MRSSLSPSMRAGLVAPDSLSSRIRCRVTSSVGPTRGRVGKPSGGASVRKMGSAPLKASGEAPILASSRGEPRCHVVAASMNSGPFLEPAARRIES